MIGIKLNIMYVNYKLQKIKHFHLYLQTIHDFDVYYLKNKMKRTHSYPKLLVINEIKMINNDLYKLNFINTEKKNKSKRLEKIYNYIFSNIYFETSGPDYDDIKKLNYDEFFLQKKKSNLTESETITLDINIHTYDSLESMISKL